MVFGCAFPKRSRARTAEDDFGNVAARRKIFIRSQWKELPRGWRENESRDESIPQMKKLDTNKLKQLSLR